MFARHLPPSAGLPHVLALDQSAADELQAAADVTGPGQAWAEGGPYDAVAGSLVPEPEALDALWRQLRPGGRVILAAAAGEPEALLEALVDAGFIHCLVEPAGAMTLYRGERPPSGSSLERHKRLAGEGQTAEAPQRGVSTERNDGRDAALPRLGQGGSTGREDRRAEALPRHLFLLITQTPNKPTWKLQAEDRVEWHAATRLDAGGQPRLLAFSSLPKAVAFMQNAILAGTLPGVNKVGKFPASAAQAWPLPVLLNPDFEAVRSASSGPPLKVDRDAAMQEER